MSHNYSAFHSSPSSSSRMISLTLTTPLRAPGKLLTRQMKQKTTGKMRQIALPGLPCTRQPAAATARSTLQTS